MTAWQRLETRVARMSDAQLTSVAADLLTRISTAGDDEVRELRIARLAVTGEIDRRARARDEVPVYWSQHLGRYVTIPED
jgi:hypothetical protein